MNKSNQPCPRWEQAFLAALAAGAGVAPAAKAARISPSTAYSHKRRNARFAREFARALGPKRRRAQRDREQARSPQWKRNFLEALAETSNVTASAARVNIPVQTVYRLRREDRAFAEKWLEALGEGYDNLEMEVLGYLRNPDPERKMDVAAATRLLARHRETVERRRGLRTEAEDKAVLDSIDRFLEDMCRRRKANEAVLAEQECDDEDA